MCYLFIYLLFIINKSYCIYLFYYLKINFIY